MTTNRPAVSDEFMTVAQVLAQHPDVTRATINHWIRNGLPTTTVGYTVLIHRDDLTDWMAHKVRKVTRWELVNKAS